MSIPLKHIEKYGNKVTFIWLYAVPYERISLFTYLHKTTKSFKCYCSRIINYSVKNKSSAFIVLIYNKYLFYQFANFPTFIKPCFVKS